MSCLQCSIATAFSLLGSFPSADILSRSAIFTPSPIFGKSLYSAIDGFSSSSRNHFRCTGGVSRISAMSDGSYLKMNLNEYMVTIDKPLGLRFAISVDGRIFVHSLMKGGNAERSRIIMVGDTVKKFGDSDGGKLAVINDYGDIQNMFKEKAGSCSLVLERPFTPFPLQRLHFSTDLDMLFNIGRVPISTWNRSLLTSNLQAYEGGGNSGFVVFSSKFLKSEVWKFLNDQNAHIHKQMIHRVPQIVCIFTGEEYGDVEWAHSSFPLQEYIKALSRSKGEIYYNHALGVQYSKITEQIYVGSCIQTEADVEILSNAGISTVLNFQGVVEAENWGINYKSIFEACQRFNVCMINYPIRDADSFDLRKKLPVCVGILLRLLKRNHLVFVTCTSGLDRSPACVIAYLHWITDTSLHAAYNFVTALHACRPDRPAIAWATWDLIAMVERGRRDGPPTHAVTFVWNGHEGEEVSLVGDFSGNWKDPIRAAHKGGPRYEVELKLQRGKYYYKFIINGQWKHSSSSPVERDERGNINNVITIGGTASVKPSLQDEPKKDANTVRVIERALTEDERFMLAKAARCLAFSVSPITLAPK